MSEHKRSHLWYRVEDPNAWFKHELEPIPNTGAQPLSVEEVEALYILADQLRKAIPKKKDIFDETLSKGGTTSDKIAADVLAIQRNPLENAHLLDSLLGSCATSNTRISQLALKTTKDLFINNLLPTRELVSFKDQPLALIQKEMKKSKGQSKQYKNHLLYWVLEDLIKNKYRSFIKILQSRSLNMIDPVKEEVIKASRSLIAVSREQRSELISLMVKKFADKSGKIAGMALTFLLNLTNPSSGNPYYCADLDKKMIVSTVSSFMNEDKDVKSKVLAVRLLTQMELNPEFDRDIAKQLIGMYIQICETYAKDKVIDATLVEAVLSGMSRAIQWGRLNPQDYDRDLILLFKIARKSSFNIAIEAIRVIFQIVQASSSESVTKSYFTVLYSRMFDSGIAKSSKIALFLNICMRSITWDKNYARSKAMVKRLVQSCSLNGSAYSCAVLIIVKQILDQVPSLKEMIKSREKFQRVHSGKAGDDEDEERYFDILDEEDAEKAKSEIKFNGDVEKTPVVPKKVDSSDDIKFYDPKEQFPDRSNAQDVGMWDLRLLEDHIHPSAAKFAGMLLSGRKGGLNYDGNPLEDFSLHSFLEKFSYKKVKPKPVKPSQFRQKLNVMAMTRPPAFSEKILEVPESLIRDDEKFFYTYLRVEKESKDESTRFKEEQEERKKETKRLRKLEDNPLLSSDKVREIRAKLKKTNNKDDWSYDDLEAVMVGGDLDDEQVDQYLLEYGSEGESEDLMDEDSAPQKKKAPKKGKKKESFGYDLGEGDIEDVARVNEDEIQDLMEPESGDEEENDEELTDGKKRKNRWSASKKMKQMKVEKKKSKPKKEKK